MKTNKKQLTEAIKSNRDKSKWWVFRKLHNKINKTISKNKSIYIKSRLAKPIDKWKFVKSMNSNQSSTTPSFINLNGYTFQSPKLIANIMNHSYIENIKSIRKNFTKSTVDPIDILRKVSTLPNTVFKRPLITCTEAEKLIRCQKNSLSTGYDAISMKII